MTAHTPGPWRMETSFDDEFAAGSFEIVACEGRYRCVLATRMPWSGRRAESWANGNLMAAGPELLAAIKHARDALNVAAHTLDFREIDQVVRAARAACDAAIAKAEVQP